MPTADTRYKFLRPQRSALTHTGNTGHRWWQRWRDVTIFTGEWELNFPSERQLTRCRHTGCCWRCWSRCVMWQPGTVKVISVTSVTKVIFGGMGAETDQTIL